MQACSSFMCNATSLLTFDSCWPSQDCWLRSMGVKLGLSFLALTYLSFSNRPNFILIWKNQIPSSQRRNEGNTKNSKKLWFYILPLFSQFTTERLFPATRRDTFWQRKRQMITFLYHFPCNLLAEFPFRKKKLTKGIKSKHQEASLTSSMLHHVAISLLFLTHIWIMLKNVKATYSGFA